MKKHINVILCLIIYCLIFCSSDVNGLQYTTGIKYAGHTLVGNHTGDIQITGNDSAEIILDLNVPVSCDTDMCIVSIPIALTLNSQNGGSNNFEYDYQVISALGITWGGQNNACIFSNGTIDCPVNNNTTLKKVELFIAGNLAHNSNVGIIIIDYNWGGYVSFYSLIDPSAYAIEQQTQQQAQQNQIVNNTDSSGNATDFNNTVSNSSLPNNSHGFDILGSLQNFVSGIEVSGSCNRISVPIPFTNQTLTLPCMTTDVYSVHFPEIVVIWQLIVRGLGYYYILVNILKLIKETIDPFNFKLEVMDL